MVESNWRLRLVGTDVVADAEEALEDQCATQALKLGKSLIVSE